MSSLRYRTIKNKVFFYTTCFLASLTVIPLFAIIWELIKKGYKQINWNFFTESAPSTLDAMLAKGTETLFRAELQTELPEHYSWLS